MTNYERFPHPSEEGIRGYGNTIAEAFEETAKALESIMVNLDKVDIKEKRKIEIKNPKKEYLLIDWLNELLYHFDVHNLVYKEFKVKIKDDELKAIAKGEEFNPKKHGSGTEIKAPTYNELKVKKKNGKWIAQCVVDV